MKYIIPSTEEVNTIVLTPQVGIVIIYILFVYFKIKIISKTVYKKWN